MKVIKKVNLNLLLTLCVVCISMLHPMTARAEGNVPGGKGNHIVYSATLDYTGGAAKGDRIIYSADYKAKEDYEIVGRIINNEIYLYVVSNGKLENISKDHLSDYVYASVYYNEDGSVKSTVSQTISSGGLTSSIFYQNSINENVTLVCQLSGLKIFKDYASVEQYAKNGSLDGMIKGEDDVDSGSYDNDIGYLHDLQRHTLMYGEQDENGFYESYDNRYTWSDYYPEYDDSYLVEVRASCEVEVRKWFGIGKSTVYNSDIRQLATGVPYKDLEYISSIEHEKSVFIDFINEYMPGNDSVSDVITASTYRLDTYYFRIYRWDEETESYKYGLWVRLSYDGTALEGSSNKTVDAGELDKNGNWKQKTDSDYGNGKKKTDIVGAGTDQESAKNEANQKQEVQDNGGKQLDLSDTNFQELWVWFTTSLYELFTGLGAIPDFFGRLFSFLPSPVIGFLALGIVVAIILRVLGR